MRVFSVLILLFAVVFCNLRGVLGFHDNAFGILNIALLAAVWGRFLQNNVVNVLGLIFYR